MMINLIDLPSPILKDMFSFASKGQTLANLRSLTKHSNIQNAIDHLVASFFYTYQNSPSLASYAYEVKVLHPESGLRYDLQRVQILYTLIMQRANNIHEKKQTVSSLEALSAPYLERFALQIAKKRS